MSEVGRLLIETITHSDASVLLVSDELDELKLCDRVLVMFRGRLVREFGPSRSAQDLVSAMEGALA